MWYASVQQSDSRVINVFEWTESGSPSPIDGVDYIDVTSIKDKMDIKNKAISTVEPKPLVGMIYESGVFRWYSYGEHTLEEWKAIRLDELRRNAESRILDNYPLQSQIQLIAYASFQRTQQENITMVNFINGVNSTVAQRSVAINNAATVDDLFLIPTTF